MVELRDRTGGAGAPEELRPVEEQVLARLARRGPLPRARSRGGASRCGWKPANARSSTCSPRARCDPRAQGFQRLYELPERVIPRRYLDAPVPSVDAFHRGLALRAVEGRGALTEAGSPSTAASAAGEAGPAPRRRARARGRRARVEVPTAPTGRRAAAAELDGSPTAAVLVCPFDNSSGTALSCAACSASTT